MIESTHVLLDRGQPAGPLTIPRSSDDPFYAIEHDTPLMAESETEGIERDLFSESHIGRR